MFSTKDTREVITITFDFAALTSTVSLPTVTVTVNSGLPDANPSAILSGSPQILGAKVMQQVVAGQTGTYYELACQITAADGFTKYVLADVLPLIAA